MEKLTIREVAKRHQITAGLIRAMERNGLVQSKGRRVGEWRCYPESECIRIGLVLEAKRMGFKAPEIRTMLASNTLAIPNERIAQAIRRFTATIRQSEAFIDRLRSYQEPLTPPR